MDKRRYDEIAAIVLFAGALFLLASLASYTPKDLPIFTSTPNRPVSNVIGIVGAWVAGALITAFGIVSYLFVILLSLWGLARVYGKTPQRAYIKLIATSLLFSTLCALLATIALFGGTQLRMQGGGLLGLYFSDILVRYLGKAGSYIFLVMLALALLTLVSEFTTLPAIIGMVKNIAAFIRNRGAQKTRPQIKTQAQVNIKPQIQPRLQKDSLTKPKIQPTETKFPETKPKAKEAPPKITIEPPRKAPVKVAPARIVGTYKLPGIDLLDTPGPIEQRAIKEDLQRNAAILEETLRDFDIEVKVTEVDQGPTITTYELEPAPGVKVGRIAALSDDIALAMKAHSVRIVAPIPGKSRVGVEVPNITTSIVSLREVLESPGYKKVANYKLPLILGKDVAGEPIIAELADMPHLLIAGTTGSGKTICVNSIITSLLYKATPDEVKFIMVDPKMVELAIFNDIPHLLSPVVTNSKKASVALEWVVNEMEERYKLFARLAVRNIAQYNEKMKSQFAKEKSENATETPPPEKLPYIVVIIDELADLMIIAQNEVEGAITRLAQLSRAVGIHMILATQRPSVDVVTGVIKANFPARISFKVASKVDSRTVLDMNGADKLLGKGDMLFLKPGDAKPARAQGTLIRDAEIERVVSFVKSQRPPEYDEEILEEKRSFGTGKLGRDDMFEEAARLVVQTGQASVSILQRRLRLGYTRAARLIDMMEEEGVVGPYCGSKARDILVGDLDELEEKFKSGNRGLPARGGSAYGGKTQEGRE
ncbi:MAG: DNA translocase FtsK [Candidatus Omnitrophota bacterium]